MTRDICLALVSALMGIFFTFLSWLVVKYGFSPKLIISQKISRISINRIGQHIYRVKIMNKGHRDAIDVRIYAKLEVKGLNQTLIGNTDSFYLNTSFDGIYPCLKKNRSIVLHIYDHFSYDARYYPKEIRDRFQSGLDLGEMLKFTGEVYLTLFVLSTDKFSGHRSITESKPYTFRDVDDCIFINNSIATETYTDPIIMTCGKLWSKDSAEE